jgi:hypothetical protein
LFGHCFNLDESLIVLYRGSETFFHVSLGANVTFGIGFQRVVLVDPRVEERGDAKNVSRTDGEQQRDL